MKRRLANQWIDAIEAEDPDATGYDHLVLPDDDELSDIIEEELQRRIEEFKRGFPHGTFDDLGL